MRKECGDTAPHNIFIMTDKKKHYKKYAIMVDMYALNPQDENDIDYTIPMYLGTAYPPKNIITYYEDFNKHTLQWENRRDAELYLQNMNKSVGCCATDRNARIVEVMADNNF